MLTESSTQNNCLLTDCLATRRISNFMHNRTALVQKMLSAAQRCNIIFDVPIEFQVLSKHFIRATTQSKFYANPWLADNIATARSTRLSNMSRRPRRKQNKWNSVPKPDESRYDNENKERKTSGDTKLFSHKKSDFISQDTCSAGLSWLSFVEVAQWHVLGARCRKVNKIYCLLEIDGISANSGKLKWVNCAALVWRVAIPLCVCISHWTDSPRWFSAVDSEDEQILTFGTGRWIWLRFIVLRHVWSSRRGSRLFIYRIVMNF